jgi:hypothetical protein
LNEQKTLQVCFLGERIFFFCESCLSTANGNVLIA